MLAATVATSAIVAAIFLERPWLWGLAIGIGTRASDLTVGEPPLSAEHIAREGASRPLALPFGLTTSRPVQWIAGSLIIMLFPLVGAFVGWVVGRIARVLTQSLTASA